MVHHNLLAQATGIPIGTFEGIGPLGSKDLVGSNGNVGDAANLFTKVISNIIGIFSVIAIIWFVILLFSGAIKLMMASGDKTKAQNAQKQITSGLVGLLIVLLGIFLINLVGSLIGLPSILFLTGFITKLKP